jgi:hypothetical protein
MMPRQVLFEEEECFFPHIFPESLSPLSASYSPIIMPLTFSLFLQLAVIQKLHMATMDIKVDYLNAALPPPRSAG